MERQDAREQLKGYLRNYVESVTQKSKGANLYVCPLCGSGTGKSGTGRTNPPQRDHKKAYCSMSKSILFYEQKHTVL